MAHDVHLHVCFACDANDGVAALAGKYLGLIGQECREAYWFLENLSTRAGNNPGPKGGLSMWGIVGNYTNEDQFVSVLHDFWFDLLRGVDGGPLSHEHVLIFVEHEQRERAIAFEIYLEEEDSTKLVVKRHECPFAWMQF